MKYTWEEFDRDVEQIHQWVKDNAISVESIYGLPKGGLVLAVKLCELLNVPIVMDKGKIAENTLIVDDISDTGKTMEPFIGKGAGTVAIFIHKDTIAVPDFHIREKRGENGYILFPWENPKKECQREPRDNTMDKI